MISGVDRKSLLVDLASSLNAKYIQPNQLKSTAKCSKGGVDFKGTTIIAKETLKGQSISSIDARTFTVGASVVNKSYGGSEVSCYQWDSAEKLEKSIIDGCKKNTMLGEDVAETFESFFKNGFFQWGKVQPESLLLKLGVYVGELLAGWVILSNSASKHIQGSHPFRGRAKAFYIPNDPAFKGVDSLIEMQDGSTIAISSKFDRGAMASLIANIVPGAVKKHSSLSASTLKDLAEICKRRNIDPERKAKDIVYEWGINYYLKMGHSNPVAVYDEIRTNKMSKETLDVISKVRDQLKKDHDTRRESALPHSLSQFFTVKMANALVKDSVDQIISIVSAKEYYQMNLDKRKFLEGECIFTCVKAGSSAVNVRGDKAVYNDLSCKQGWVNYEVVKR